MSSQPRIQRGGTVPYDALYVARQADHDFLRLLIGERLWLNIFGCRTMGKSSLFVRHTSDCEQAGYRWAILDLALACDGIETPAEWMSAFAEGLAYTLKIDAGALRAIVNECISSRMTVATSIHRMFRKGVLPRLKEPFILALDELDSARTLSFFGGILLAFRSLREELITDPPAHCFLLVLISLYPLPKLAPSLAARSGRFAEPIEMEDFENSRATIEALQGAFTTSCMPTVSALEWLLLFTGGQPFLTMEILHSIREKSAETEAAVEAVAMDLVSMSSRSPEQYLQQLQKIEGAVMESKDKAYDALFTYEGILTSRAEALSDLQSAEPLLIAGLICNRDGKLVPKGDLFRLRFDVTWARAKQLEALRDNRPQYRGRVAADAKGARLCVINAGGTLGMIEKDGVVVAPKDAQEYKDFFTSLSSIAEDVQLHNLMPRDSINVFPDQWVSIARFIYEKRHDGFSGFVVAHGTDTLAFTASAVAFALGPNLPFPVVFVGAQTTPDVPYGDAHVNLYRACEVAKKNIPEVMICFGNFAFRAVRAQKKDDRRFEGFESPTYAPLVEITGEITVRKELIRKMPKKQSDIQLRDSFSPRVLVIPQYPGLEREFFMPLAEQVEGTNACNGIIIQTLGAGNVATESPYSFLPLVRAAYEKGIPVIVTSQYPPDPGSHTKYAPASQPLKAGAIHAGNMTQAAAVTKFRWVLAQVMQRKDWLKLDPARRKSLVSRLMVEQSVVGEF